MQQFTLTELWSHMGLFARLIVGILLLMSLSSVIVMAERLVFFARSKRDSRRAASRLEGVLSKSGLSEAALAAKDLLGYLGRVLGAGLGAFRRTTTAGTSADLTIESVARALERQASREVDTLKRGLNLLATVGSTAPFVGLLGTVVGIINAFRAMAATGSGGLGTVSSGIAEALVTTALGLLVAIPAVMAYNYMQGWVDRVTVDMTESSNELLDVVALKLGEGASATKAG
jgi:biopolymer transport protein ExbB/TolQ